MDEHIKIGEEMKNWTEIYDKYKGTELIKEFLAYCKKECVQTYKEDFDLLGWEEYNIKDIWGYLICFAETKDEFIFELKRGVIVQENVGGIIGKQKILTYYSNPERLEQAMLWCADKFFEVVK